MRKSVDKTCFAVINILLQFIALLCGRLHAMNRLFCSMLDMQTMGNSVRSRYNEYICKILCKLGDASIRNHLQYTKNRILYGNAKQLFVAIDEAWFARARNNCSVTYGFIHDLFANKFIGCDVVSRLKGDCELNNVTGITRSTTGKALGWKLSEKFIDDTTAWVSKSNEKRDENVEIMFICDNDHEYQTKFDTINMDLSLQVFVSKGDDINHALGKIYADAALIKQRIKMVITHEYNQKIQQIDVSDMKFKNNKSKLEYISDAKKKLEVERNHLINTALRCVGKCTMNYIYSNVKYSAVVAHPKDFDTIHVCDVVTHAFNGKDHHECVDWCKGRDKDGNWVEHRTTLPNGVYWDRHNNMGHKYAFAVMIHTLKRRFDHENCVRLRNTPRSNANENGHSMVAGIEDKHTRPPRRHIGLGIVNAVAVIKNEGRGRLYQDFCQHLGLHIGRTQMERFVAIQNTQKYKSKYAQKASTKIRRHKNSTQYKKWEARSQKYCPNRYQTDINITQGCQTKGTDKFDPNDIDMDKCNDIEYIQQTISKPHPINHNISSSNHNKTIDNIPVNPKQYKRILRRREIRRCISNINIPPNISSDESLDATSDQDNDEQSNHNKKRPISSIDPDNPTINSKRRRRNASAPLTLE